MERKKKTTKSSEKTSARHSKKERHQSRSNLALHRESNKSLRSSATGSPGRHTSASQKQSRDARSMTKSQVRAAAPIPPNKIASNLTSLQAASEQHLSALWDLIGPHTAENSDLRKLVKMQLD